MKSLFFLFRSTVCVVLAFYAAVPAHAHEFWLSPVTAPLVAGNSANLTLRVGEYFEGELVGFSVPQTAEFRQYNAAGTTDLHRLLPPVTPVASLLVPVLTPGTHLIGFNSQPNTVTLSADSFHAYLHDEGLDFIRAQREAAGTARTPGRERYRRFVKTLVNVAPKPAAAPTQDTKLDGNAGVKADSKVDSKLDMKPDVTHLTVIGQRLEVLPINNPLAMVPGDALGVRVLFDGKPLKDALLKAWHRRGSQTLIIRGKTSADGSAAFDLPYAGPWMISVVHMVPAVGVKDIDWDSLWGNLSFSLASKP